MPVLEISALPQPGVDAVRVRAQVVETLGRELRIDAENVFAIVDELTPQRLGS